MTKDTTLVSSRRNFPLPHRGHQVLFAYPALGPSYQATNPLYAASSRYLPGLRWINIFPPPTPTSEPRHGRMIIFSTEFFSSQFSRGPRSSARLVVNKGDRSGSMGVAVGSHNQGTLRAPQTLNCPAVFPPRASGSAADDIASKQVSSRGHRPRALPPHLCPLADGRGAMMSERRPGGGWGLGMGGGSARRHSHPHGIPSPSRD